jgi:hypothetical protein
LILAVISGDDFALAGSGAIREHGRIDRPTLDIDLFTIQGGTGRSLLARGRSGPGTGGRVANKVGALYSRAAARDYLDVDVIRQSGRFTDAELLRLATEHDPGFDQATFAEQLGQVATLRPAGHAASEAADWSQVVG